MLVDLQHCTDFFPLDIPQGPSRQGKRALADSTIRFLRSRHPSGSCCTQLPQEQQPPAPDTSSLRVLAILGLPLAPENNKTLGTSNKELSVCYFLWWGRELGLEELKVSGALLGSLKKSLFFLLPDLLLKFF